MKLFIDTADIEEIKHAFSSGIVDGITTNPSLLKKASKKYGGDIAKYIDEVLKVAKTSPVSLEVDGGSADEMYHQAKNLYKRFSKRSNHVVIKIPIDSTLDKTHPFHLAGLKTIKRLSEEKIPVNVTLIFTPEQALLAAKAGAKYVSPFCGRIDDLLRKKGKGSKKDSYYPLEGITKKGVTISDEGVVSGVDLVAQIVDIFSVHNISTEVLAASIRNKRQVRECALVGCDIATISPSLIEEMLKHEKTREGMNKFTDDIPKEYRELLKK